MKLSTDFFPSLLPDLRTKPVRVTFRLTVRLRSAIVSPCFLLKCIFDLLCSVSEWCLVTQDFFSKLPIIPHEASCLHYEALMSLLLSGCHSLKLLSMAKFISRILDKHVTTRRWGVILFIRKDFSLRK